MNIGSMIGAGLSIFQGIQDKKAANKAARSSAAVSEKNARIIERDIDIATRQIQILRDNLSISNQRKSRGFSAVQARCGMCRWVAALQAEARRKMY